MEQEKQFQVMQQFRFQEQFQSVRSMVDQNDEPWFVAQDVCDILEHSNSRMALQSLEDDEKGVSKVYTLGGEQEVNVINESGLYNLIFRSNKPQAKVFRKWVTSEVLPQIRKQGHYGFAQKPEIPTEPQQALAMWAYLVKQERSLSAQLRIIRSAKGGCLTRLQEVAPPYVMPETVQTGLFQ
jgi:prophage antirepressor-like protein